MQLWKIKKNSLGGALSSKIHAEFRNDTTSLREISSLFN
jgi:hypothetical protein